MIARLAGELRVRTPEELVVDVGGVGYQVFVSFQTYSRLPAAGERVELHVHTHVREDALQLFGFADAAERRLFLLLKEVSGIGPRLALNVLSGMPAADLRGAIRAGDLARLTRIPGVGRKLAERMVVELREKAALEPEGTVAAPAAGDGNAAEAVSALVNLGFRRPDAESAVKAAVAAGSRTFEEIVRDALKGMSR